MNDAHESNILEFDSFVVFSFIWEKNANPVRKTSFKKLYGKDLQLERSHGELRLPLLKEDEAKVAIFLALVVFVFFERPTSWQTL